MAFLRLSILLRLSRPLFFFFLLIGLLLLPIMVIESVHVASSTEVRLRLNTKHPHFFSEVDAFVTGFREGKKNGPEIRTQLPPLRADSAGYELADDPHLKLLRYEEPDFWKRLALFYLGATDIYLSLAWPIFFLVSSWWLWLLLLDVTPATPFTFSNARRLRNLGLLVLGVDFAQELAHVAIRAMVPAFRAVSLAEPLSHYVYLNTDDSLPGWAVGVILLLIAAVYQRGVELSQEAELTI